jgi:enhancing lycopene biosynthesis protein 2
MKSARALSHCGAFYWASCLAVVLCTLAVSARLAWAQFSAPPGAQCNDFSKLSAEAQKRSAAVGAAMKAKADRKQLCTLMTSFVAAETTVVKFLEDNKVWCGVPEQVLASSKANHEKSLKFRTMACSEDAPRPKAPSLSDAIKTPSVDTAKNTKTGRGTFDTLTGNPLAR